MNVLIVIFHCINGYIITEVLSSTVVCQADKNATCTQCVGQTMVLECPAGHNIIGSIQGGFRNPTLSKSCGIEQNDCLAPTAMLISRIMDCLWKKPYCEFKLYSFDSPVGVDIASNPDCADFSIQPVYLMAYNLSCVKDNNIHTICTEDWNVNIHPNEEFYITTPNYPLPYGKECSTYGNSKSWTMKTSSSPDYCINIDVLFMHLPKQGNVCTHDYVVVSYKDFSGKDIEINLCGYDKTSMLIHSNEVRLAFNAIQSSHTNQGLVLKYYLSKLPSPTTSSTTTTLTTAHTEGGHPETTIGQEPPNTTVDLTDINMLQTGIIVAVLILLVIILAIVLLLIRRHGNNIGRMDINNGSNTAVTIAECDDISVRSVRTLDGASV